jgi:hypothetical protein
MRISRANPRLDFNAIRDAFAATTLSLPASCVDDIWGKWRKPLLVKGDRGDDRSPWLASRLLAIDGEQSRNQPAA